MTARRWIAMTALTIALVVAAAFAFSYTVDPYGVFRAPKGRNLSIYYSERRAKFLMGRRYIPENFDGLILGPSSSSNWDPSIILGYRLYNESLQGGNITEEKILLEQVLRTGQEKLAICIIYPTMTDNHDVGDGLDTVNIFEAIGSIHALINGMGDILKSMHVTFAKDDTKSNGAAIMHEANRYGIGRFPASYFMIDPVAVKDYQATLQALHDHGVQVLYIVPPLYEPCLAPNRDQYDAYLHHMQALLPAGPLLNFDTPEFESFRNNPQNFGDCYHLRATGASRMGELLANLVPQAVTAYYSPHPELH